jgi:CBS domain-containing protein
MASQVSQLMATDVTTVDPHASLRKAAQLMREKDIGDVVVTEGDRLCGILTDRDITVRAVADNCDPEAMEVGEVASKEVRTLDPNDSVEEAVSLMREAAVRRAPVVQGGELIGIVSLGDLAREQDRRSALGQISAAPANR